MKNIRTCVIVFLCFCTSVYGESQGLTTSPSQADLARMLSEGGFNLFMRHAKTSKDRLDSPALDLDDCATQRNLSPQGWQQAGEIGDGFQALGIPVTHVSSSPYCRCIDTARIAFQVFEIDKNLQFAMNLPKAERQRVAESLKEALAQPIPEGENHIFVSHSANLKEAVGIWPGKEGALYIFRPSPMGDPDFVGLIEPTFWVKHLAGLE